MRNLYENCLSTIKAHQLPGIQFNPGFIFPNFNGFSVANLPATIFHSLGTSLELSKEIDKGITGEFAGEYDDVIMLVVDSLGMPLFERLSEMIENDRVLSAWNPLWDQAILGCLTSTIPSTTTTVLTALWTGAEASQHGVVGYEMWLQEFGVTANMISHAPVDQADDIGSLKKLGFDPLKFLPVESIGSLLKKEGIETNVYLQASIAGSGLSQMLMADASIHAWRTYDELWQQLLAQFGHPGSRSYTNIYLGDIDTISHRRGPGHELVWQAWLDFSSQLAQFLIKLKAISHRKILFLLTADHGQIDQNINEDFELKNHPNLTAMLARMPSGESRMPYFYPLPGFLNKTEEYIHQAWPNQFQLLTRENFIATGALGSVHPSPNIQERIGELVLIPNGQNYLHWLAKTSHLLGRHGGFQQDEMIVPFFAIPL